MAAFLPPVTSEIPEATTRADTVIDLGDHFITLRNHAAEKKVIEWLTANGVNPYIVLLYQTITCLDGRIRCRATAQDEDDDNILNENRDGWAETQVDVPMTHAPHEFGL